MAQHPADRFQGQFGPPLLQPEMPAEQQQHRPVHRVGHLSALHQALGVAQLDKRLGIVAAVGRQHCQPEEAIQHALVLAMQAHAQAGFEAFGGQGVMPLAQCQMPSAQGNPAHQRPGLETLLDQHGLHAFQQALGPVRCAPLLQQLRMIQLQ